MSAQHTPNDETQASCADEGSSNVRFHVVVRKHRLWYPACGTGNDGTTMMSSQTVPAHSVQTRSRCRKPACRAAFSAADAKATGQADQGSER